MNHQSIFTNATAIFLSLFVTLPTLNCISLSIPKPVRSDSIFSIDSRPYASVYDLWNVDDDIASSLILYNELKEDGWVKDYVEFEDFDYIFVLTKQITSMYDNVDQSLVLAMIVVESNFYANASSPSGAKGLMQLMPIYHTKRMEQFVEECHEVNLDDFYNPRLNIVTGTDYISELIDQTNGDIYYALMCYNQGVSTANRNYAAGRRSYYAEKVLELQKQIQELMN